MPFDVNTLKFELIRSRRKTVSVQIKCGEVIVRAPLRMKTSDITSFLCDKKEWIEKHLNLSLEKQNEIKDAVPFTSEELKDLSEKTLKTVSERVEHYSKIIGVDYSRICVRRQRTRWGSCSSKGNLNFNCLLALLPSDVIDSIVVHELCHRIHMNHSKDFYREVKKVFPNYEKWNKWLKENGHLYLCRL